jgi:hypothetical protein
MSQPDVTTAPADPAPETTPVEMTPPETTPVDTTPGETAPLETKPKKISKKTWLIAGGGFGAVLLIAVTIASTLVIARSGGPHPAASPTAAIAIDPEQQATAAEPVPTETTPAPGPSLAATDLTLTPKVTEKQCFGSAGCNVTVKITVGYGGPTLSEDDTWEVTYQLTGDESGPIVGSFELSGAKYDQDEISLSTKSSKTKITAKATDVEVSG